MKITTKEVRGFRTLVQKIKELINNEIWVIREYSKDYGGNLYRGFYERLKFRLHTLLIHKPSMLYYSIRNYTRYRHLHDQNMIVIWELVKPLTLTYSFRSTDNFCPSCAKLKEDDEYFECDDLNHAEFVKFYERPIWSFNFKYYYTACTCEDLLFEPLENYYNSGGEDGSNVCTRADAQWSINEELGWDLDPMKRHKKQLLPRDWRRKNG